MKWLVMLLATAACEHYPQCNNPEQLAPELDYNQCVYNEKTFPTQGCAEWAQKQKFTSYGDCITQRRDDRFADCRATGASYDQCLSARKERARIRAMTPEQRCEEQSKVHGGYWECLKLERAAEAEERESRRRHIADEAERDERRLERQRQADQDLIRGLQPAKKKVTCRTRYDSVSRVLVEECE